VVETSPERRPEGDRRPQPPTQDGRDFIEALGVERHGVSEKQALFREVENGVFAADVSDAEVGMASRYLSDSFLFRTETLGAVADLTVKLAILGLPDDYFDSYRAALRKLDNATVYEAAQKYFKIKNPVLVVAGDAERIAKPLSHFAKVVIIDPEHDFQPGKTLPLDPSQSLEAAPVNVPVPGSPPPGAPAPPPGAAK